MLHKDEFSSLVSTYLRRVYKYSPAAVNLLLGTCAVESDFGKATRQFNGPALGVFQIEPSTMWSFYSNYFKYRPEDYTKIIQLSGEPEFSEYALENNLIFQIVFTRYIYWAVPEPLPDENDIVGLALYWKTHFNTIRGKGTIESFIEKYERYVGVK